VHQADVRVMDQRRQAPVMRGTVPGSGPRRACRAAAEQPDSGVSGRRLSRGFRQLSRAGAIESLQQPTQLRFLFRGSNSARGSPTNEVELRPRTTGRIVFEERPLEGWARCYGAKRGSPRGANFYRES
jgi:hypothetical protein